MQSELCVEENNNFALNAESGTSPSSALKKKKNYRKHKKFYEICENKTSINITINLVF